MTFGQPFTPAQVGQVQSGSAAEHAGIKPGDVIVSINGDGVQSFEDVQQDVRLNPGVPMTIMVKRDGKDVRLEATPAKSELTDRFGNHYEIGLLGIAHNGVDYVKRDPATALIQAGKQTWDLSASTLKAMWQIVIGTRGTDELGGPLRIAQMSRDVVQGGVVAVVWFMAVLSINLGLINLFPVPVLDGGHLLFYAAEALRGKPLGQRAQEYGFRIGLALVLTLMVFATWNDLVHLRIVEFVKRLVT
jgi:regulator of sigma E protease